MTALMLYTFIAVYYVGGTGAEVLFLPLLYLGYKSKATYFWIAYLFIILNSPAWFFGRLSADAVHRIPLYSLGSGLSFSFQDLFLILLVFKSFNNWFKEKKLVIGAGAVLIFLYFSFISLPFSFVLGVPFKELFNTMRFIAFYSLIPISFTFLRSKEKIFLFGYLLFPYTLLNLIDLFYAIGYGTHMVNLLDPGAREMATNTVSGSIRPIPGGLMINFLGLVIALALDEKGRLIKGIDYLIMAFVSLAFFISATRALIIMILVIILVKIWFSSNSLKNLMLFAVFGFLSVQVTLYLGLINEETIHDSVSRFDVLYQALTDESGSRSLDTVEDRLNNDIPMVKKGISHSPVFGVGISSLFKAHFNNDLGFYNTILMLGYVGFSLFVTVLLTYIARLYYFSNRMPNLEGRNQLRAFMAGWLGILAGYSASWDFFNFYPDVVMFVSCMVAFPDILWKEATQAKNILS